MVGELTTNFYRPSPLSFLPRCGRRLLLPAILLLISVVAYSQAVPGSATSTRLPDSAAQCGGYRIIGDSVYLFGNVIRYADPATFRCLAAEYARDKNHVFFGTKRFSIADPASFTPLHYGYSKDKNHVYYDYYSGSIIPGADPKTFLVLDLSVSKDKNHVYFWSQPRHVRRAPGIDAGTFRELNGWFFDKNYLYNCLLQPLKRRDTVNIFSIIFDTNDSLADYYNSLFGKSVK